MGDDALRQIAEKGQKIISAADALPMQHLEQRHLDAIAAAHEATKDLPAITFKEEPDPLVRDASDIIQNDISVLRNHFKPDECASVIRDEFGWHTYRFFVHDIAHLGDHMLQSMCELDNLGHGIPQRGRRHCLEHWQSTNEMLEQVRTAYCHPWQMLRRMALDRLGEQPEYTPVQLRPMLNTAGSILCKRFDALLADHAEPLAQGEKRIVVDAEDITIQADPGTLFSIAYNNIKNSMKKIEERSDDPDDEKRQENRYNMTFSATASCKRLDDRFIALTFTDSAEGIDISKMLAKAADAMRQGDELTWPSSKMHKRFKRWQENDYAFNTLTLEDATNVAFMAQMTGARTPSQFSSGMGLYGTRYLVEQLGGAILYATTFDGQHPVFCYILPYEPRADAVDAMALRRKMIRGKAA